MRVVRLLLTPIGLPCRDNPICVYPLRADNEKNPVVNQANNLQTLLAMASLPLVLTLMAS